MAALLRSPPTFQTLKTLVTQQTPLHRYFCTAPSHHNHHQQNHKYLSPSEFINSWDPPKDPKEAKSKLAHLRRQYAKQVKEVRKEYIQEMELQRIEKQRKDEAKKEALRIANEERKAAKMAAKKAKAAERQLVEEEFRQTLLKERTEKLEYWRKREKLMLEKKEKKNEILRRQSSVWIDESEMEKKTVEAIVDAIPLWLLISKADELFILMII